MFLKSICNANNKIHISYGKQNYKNEFKGIHKKETLLKWVWQKMRAEQSVVQRINTQRLRWLGHVVEELLQLTTESNAEKSVVRSRL